MEMWGVKCNEATGAELELEFSWNKCRILTTFFRNVYIKHKYIYIKYIYIYEI